VRHFFHSKAKLATLKFCGLRGWWGWGRGRCGAAPAFGADLRRRRQKAEQADRGLVPIPLSSSSLSLPLSSVVARRPPATNHQIFSACGVAPTLGCPAAQKAESRASRSGTTPSPPPSRGGGDLVLSLSSGLALLSLSLSLSARRSSATKFSRPAAQHPLWAGLRCRRQKAE